MKIKDLPEEIKELAIKRRKETGVANEEFLDSAFAWDNTVEGKAFWSNIDEGNFEPFYRMYPKDETCPNGDYLPKEGEESLFNDNPDAPINSWVKRKFVRTCKNYYMALAGSGIGLLPRKYCKPLSALDADKEDKKVIENSKDNAIIELMAENEALKKEIAELEAIVSADKHLDKISSKELELTALPGTKSEKDYEIIAYRMGTGVVWEKLPNERFGNKISNAELEETHFKPSEIYSVKNSKGEVFTIGDEVYTLTKSKAMI